MILQYNTSRFNQHVKLKIIINKPKIIALAHLGQAEKQNKGTKPSLQLTWAGRYKKRLIIGLLIMVLNKTIYTKIIHTWER